MSVGLTNALSTELYGKIGHVGGSTSPGHIQFNVDEWLVKVINKNEYDIGIELVANMSDIKNIDGLEAFMYKIEELARAEWIVAHEIVNMFEEKSEVHKWRNTDYLDELKLTIRGSIVKFIAALYDLFSNKFGGTLDVHEHGEAFGRITKAIKKQASKLKEESELKEESKLKAFIQTEESGGPWLKAIQKKGPAIDAWVENEKKRVAEEAARVADGVAGRGESVIGGGEGGMTALLIVAVILLLVWFVFKKPLFVGIAAVVIGYCYYNDVDLSTGFGGNLGTNLSTGFGANLGMTQ